MRCPICKEKGYFTGSINNHIEPEDYYEQIDFYYCDKGHDWGIKMILGERKETIIVTKDKGDMPLREYRKGERKE